MSYYLEKDGDNMVYSFVQQKPVHLNCVNFTVSKLYLNKDEFKWTCFTEVL